MTWFFLATIGSIGLIIIAAINCIGKGNPYD